MSATGTTTLSTNPWARILDALEKKINRHSYDTWLKPTRYSHSSGGVLFVRVPTIEFRHAGRLSSAPTNGGPSPARFDWDGAAQPNPRYTFDAFVIVSGNQFAHAA